MENYNYLNMLNRPERIEYLLKAAITISTMPLDFITKEPIEKGWQKYSHQLRICSPGEFQNRNAGFVTGPASGLLVLDVDNAEVFESYCRRNNLTVPKTYKVRTSSGRYHHYFKYRSTR